MNRFDEMVEGYRAQGKNRIRHRPATTFFNRTETAVRALFFFSELLCAS